MFALKEIIKDKLYALAIGDTKDVFHECFDNWQDVLYLYSYFKANKKALEFYDIDSKKAVALVLEEAGAFFEDILEIANGNRKVTSLDKSIFIPLHHNDDFGIPLLESKAYGREKGRSLLRLYAIRLTDGAYIIVGGLIKVTAALQDYEEGKMMLARIKKVARFLMKNGLLDAFDIESVINEQ